jgi:hypothetical protein
VTLAWLGLAWLGLAWLKPTTEHPVAVLIGGGRLDADHPSRFDRTSSCRGPKGTDERRHHSWAAPRPDGSEFIFDVRTTTWFAGPCVEDLPGGCGGCVATIA